MKKRFIVLLTILASLVYQPINAKTVVTDTYNFRMSMKIPRIYNNMTSKGYRKYQNQLIKGTMIIRYEEDSDKPIISITNLVNKTHKINNQNITYRVNVDNYGEFVYPRWNVIGNNANNKFNTASVVFYIDAEPSYNVGEDEPDNTLLLTLSGMGNVSSKTMYSIPSKYIRTLRGNGAGTLGCGCRAYGHTSPTRVMGAFQPTDIVDDVASVYGSWTASFKSRCITNE